MNPGVGQQGSAKLRAKWGQIRTYADLQKQLHRDLMAQHPEWIEANGDCPHATPMIGGWQSSSPFSSPRLANHLLNQYDQPGYAFIKQWH